MSQYKIIVAGAGIGGLTAAASLLQQGHQVEVYEAAAELGEVGAGIQCSANAVKVLYSLGLKNDLEWVAVRPEAYNFRRYDTADIIQSVPLGAQHEARFGAPYLQLYRADLHAVLVSKVRRLAPECIRLNSRIESFAESEDGISVTLAGGRQVHGDLLVGADGIKSAVRKQIVGDTPADYTGQVAWRVVVPTDRLPADFLRPNVDVWCGPGRHAVVYYLRAGKLLNFVGLVKYQGWTEESWTVRCPWDELKADFAGWHPTIQTILDAADRDQCYRWALNNRPPLPYWSTPRATLLGDAAHPTLPYLAQGAAMAIEDAAVLTRCLTVDADVAEALDRYQRNRIDRTARIVAESTANAGLFQMQDMAALEAAFAQRNIDKERSSWLYSYDALNVPLD